MKDNENFPTINLEITKLLIDKGLIQNSYIVWVDNNCTIPYIEFEEDLYYRGESDMSFYDTLDIEQGMDLLPDEVNGEKIIMYKTGKEYTFKYGDTIVVSGDSLSDVLSNTLKELILLNII